MISNITNKLSTLRLKGDTETPYRSTTTSQFNALVQCGMRETWRSPFFWVLIVAGTIFFQSHYFLSVQYEQLFADRSSALGINNTVFYFGNLPTFAILLFQLAVVLVTVNSLSNLDTRVELCSRPLKNITILLGHVGSASVSIFSLACVNIAIVFVGSFIGSVLSINFGNIPSVVPALNLLLFDLPPTLIFWSSFALLVAIAVRSLIAALFSTSIVVLIIWFLTFSVPGAWLEILSSYSYVTMVVSDLAPRFPDVEILLNRIMVLFASLGICSLTSIFWGRQEDENNRRIWFGLGSFTVAMILFGLTILNSQLHASERRHWEAAHGIYEVHKIADLVSLTGNVTIRPGEWLDLDLELTLFLPDRFDATELVFSFNPGMKIERLTLAGVETDFSFELGVLSIPYECHPCSDEQTVVLAVRAFGEPDTRFGYLEPQLDYLRSGGTSLHLRKLFGTENALFSNRFVALMPGIRWYPTPGRLSVDKHVDALVRAPELFDVELLVSIKRGDWNVAGPGLKTRVSSDDSSFTFRSSHAVPPFAIIASKFDSKVVVAGNMTVEMLVHERHAPYVQPLSIVEDEFTKYFSQRLQELAELGIRFKNPSITFVEVPNHLRLVGGHGMQFVHSMPGVVLFRESSIPLSNIDDIVDRIQSVIDEEKDLNEHLFSYLIAYDEQNMVLGTIGSALANQLNAYAYRQFEFDNVALNQLRRMLVSESIEKYTTYLDAELIASFAPLMRPNPIATVQHLITGYNAYSPLLLDSAMDQQLYFGEAARKKDRVSLNDLDVLGDPMESRRILWLKLADLSDAMRSILGEKTLHMVVSPLQETSADTCRESVECIYRAAESLGLQLGPFIREWLTTDVLPSYRSSPLALQEVSIEETDIRYFANFYVRNDSEAHGVLQFSIDEEIDYMDVEPGVEISPQESFQINVYSEHPMRGVTVNAFHSKNGHFSPLPYRINGDDVIQHLRPLVESVKWQPQDDEYIIVDNMDTGARVLTLDEPYNALTWNILRSIDLVPDLPPAVSNGVLVSTRQLPFESNKWTLADLWTSFGRYRQTVWQTKGGTPPVVRFTAELPSSGRWEIDYHFPFLYPYWTQYGRYNFIVHVNDEKFLSSIDANGLSGWIRLGTYDIRTSTVHVDLESVEPNNSTMIADAVRWKQLEVQQ